MAPVVLRQTILWCVPTIAVILSFLWFKKRRNAIKSDPGGTLRCSGEEDIKTNFAKQKTNKLLNSSSKPLVDETEEVSKESCVNGPSEVLLNNTENIIPEVECESSFVNNLTVIEKNLIQDSAQMEKFVGNSQTKHSDLVYEHTSNEAVHIIPMESSRVLLEDSFTNFVNNERLNFVNDTDKKLCEEVASLLSAAVEVVEVVEDILKEKNVKGITADGNCEESENKYLTENCECDTSEMMENITTDVVHLHLTESNPGNSDANGFEENSVLEINKEESSGSKVHQELKTSCSSPMTEDSSPNLSVQVDRNVTNCVDSGDIANIEVMLNETDDIVCSNNQENMDNKANVEEVAVEQEANDNNGDIPSSEVMSNDISDVVHTSNNENTDNEASVEKVPVGQEASGNNNSDIPSSEMMSIDISDVVHTNKNDITDNEASVEVPVGQEASGNSGDAASIPVAERDSANHSPADVMLASPSISNYSDAHSERSSDSGKGCSYVATPPSRTPASCSSLSGDHPPHSVYEFVIPQQLVGRLIGRYGCFVHQIKTKTHANILIKRHPDTAKLKICAVEGTQMDIDSALEMIREKFPAKRYPTLTLEQVCFLPPVPTVSLLSEHLQLQLVEGVNNDVILSSLVSPSHFFLQQPTHPTYPALNQLVACMNMCYNEANAPLLPAVEAGIICAAPAMGGWYRAQIIAVDPESDTCDVKFIDYGGFLTLPNSEVRQIRSDFMTLPFQAAECYLAHVIPPGGAANGWSAEARNYVEALTQGQVLQAQVCGYAEDGIPVVYLFATHGTQVVPIHQELVAQSLAEWWEPSESENAAH